MPFISVIFCNLLIYSTAGKDRTGIIAAIILKVYIDTFGITRLFHTPIGFLSLRASVTMRLRKIMPLRVLAENPPVQKSWLG
jgi:hypothetical protein